MESYQASSKPGASRFMLSTFHSPRDPGGLLPVGIESMMGEDPVGTVVSEEKDENLIQMSQRLSVPATPTRLTPASPQVLALLAGFPPPPPPDTPPPRRRRSKSTPRGKIVELPTEVSFSTDQVEESISKSIVPDSLPITSTKDLTDLNPVVAQRSQSAQAIFNGDHLALKFRQQDQTHSMDPPEEGDRFVRNVLPQNQATPRVIVTVSQEKVPSPQRSPFSTTTEPRSNKQLAVANPYQDNLLSSDPQVSDGNGLTTTNAIDNKGSSVRILYGRERSNNHRRNHSEEATDPGKLVTVSQHRRSNTTGSNADVVLSKRLIPSTRATSVTNSRRPATPDPATISSSGGTVATGATSGKSISSDSGRSGRPPTPSNQPAPKAVRKGFFKLLFGGKKKRATRSDYSEVRPEQDDWKAVHRHADMAKGGKIGSPEVILEDASARPSEEELVLPAYSTDLHEDDHECGDGRGSVVFAHDEVSTLTAPTMASYHQRRDPTVDAERTSEPMGHYWNHIVGSSGNRDDSGFPSIDPFTGPFFKEPKGASPVPKIAASVELRVDVPAYADPVGDSPLNSHLAGMNHNLLHDPSPQGFQVRPAFEKDPSHDPVGESPLHKHERGPTALLDGTPYAPDPPLYLSTIGTEASSTCSKEEAASATSVKETISEQSSVALSAGHPPRPPSPSLAVGGRNSPRRQSSPRRPPLRLHPFPMEAPSITSPTSSATPQDYLVVSDPSGESEPAVSIGRGNVIEASSILSSRVVSKSKNRSIVRRSPRLDIEEKSSRYDRNGPVDSDEALLSLSFASYDSEQVSPSPSSIQSDFSPSNRSLVSQPTDEFDCHGDVIQKSSSNVSASSKTSLLSRAEARKVRSRRSKNFEARSTSPVKCSSGVSSPVGDAEFLESVSNNANTENLIQLSEPETSGNESFEKANGTKSEANDKIEKSSTSVVLSGNSTSVVHLRRSFSPKTLLRRKAMFSKEFDTALDPNNGHHDAKQERNDQQQYDHERERQKTMQESKQAKQLTISSAARMNAKAVAYLHSINGEPSPRLSWRRPQDSDDELKPSSGTIQKNAATRDETVRDADIAEASPPPTQLDGPSPRTVAPYKKRFSGRGLARKVSAQLPNARNPVSTNRTTNRGNVSIESTKHIRSRNVAIGTTAVKVGLRKLRHVRDDAIASGRCARVVPSRQLKTPKVVSYFTSCADPEPLDPIQRAGRRLLNRSAIPVQAAARRFLAKRRAVDRMWALLEIQSFIRRWRAEASFLASRSSALLVQRLYRGSLCRRTQHSKQCAAVQIQKIVRGYIYAARVYEDVYRVIILQAMARRSRCRREFMLLKGRATSIQSMFRGHLARRQRKRCLHGVTKIQAYWRSHLIRTCFQFVVVDIIIVQSMLRRWLARRELHLLVQSKRNWAATTCQTHYRTYRARVLRQKMRCSIWLQTQWRRYASVRNYKRCRSARMIQTCWRGYSCRTTYNEFKASKSIQCAWRCSRDRTRYRRFRAARQIQSMWRAHDCLSSYRQYKAAARIQASWRGFQAYTDYVFVLVDVLVIQRSVRRWISKRKVCALRREQAALIIETHWRRQRAQKSLLFDLMHIILVQSVVRRYLTHGTVAALKQDRVEATIAAGKIQASWRGFWQFSHFVILRYETVKLQSFIRGRKVRNDYIMTLGSIIVVQSRCRKLLAARTAESLRATKAVFYSLSEGLRESGAAKRIQFFWRVVLECRREKKAAVVIERFFLKVREEVDREIQKAALRKQTKRRRSHRKNSNNSDCESSVDQDWIDSSDELSVSRSRSTDSTSVLSRASTSCKRGNSVLSSAESLGHKSGVRHRASSPTLNLVMRHERETKSKPERQGVTNKSAFQPENSQDLRRTRRFRLSLDASEEPVETPERYMKMYGVRSAPLRGSKERHFFGDVPDCVVEATPKSTISGPISSRSDASTSVGWRRLLVESNSSATLEEVEKGGNAFIFDKNHENSSPRHGKIHVMKPRPEPLPNQSSSAPDVIDEAEYLGEDFGMI